MTKVKFLIQRSATAACLRHRRLLLTTFAAVVGWTLLAVTNGAEQVDSGWAIAVPSPLATDSKAADPHQQMVLRHVLEQKQPLLQKPSPTSAAQTSTDRSHSGLRFAVRPDGVDGWRPAAQSNAPVSVDTSAHIVAPHLGAPIVASDGDEAECDCSGKSAAENSTKPIPQQAADSLPNADAPSSQTTLSDSDIEAAQNPTAEEPAPDAVSEPTPVESAVESGAEDDATTPIAAEPETTSSTKSITKTPTQVAAEAVPPPPLTRQLLSLKTRVRSVLKGYYRKPLNSKDHDPWEAMHGMLAYGVQSRIREGSSRGEPITSVGWLCYNKPCKGQTLLYVTPAGEVRAKYGVGLQGHLGQLLAMLAQCHVSADYPIHVGKSEFTIHDLIEAEKKTCYPKSELTFKLIALQHYIDLNDKWVNDQGLEWDMPRLVREELAQPIRGAACGGTHRLSGLSLTVKTRVRRGEPLDGEYLRAAEFVKKYQQYAFRLQNRDGSLSTSWFRGGGDDDDINRRIKTTGHILEWLCYSLSDEELRDQRTIRAVTYLANLMYSNYDNEWEIGPRSHATHALLLYDERVFQPFDKEGAVATYQPPNPHMAKRVQQDTIRR